MNENGTKRREWVKTAAIIFLSVLLVLTFFSNTIMNYSLPEVAAQYIESGTITAKIRGTGMVESGDLYNVKLEGTNRKIESVQVREGDEVQKGDILFVLTDEEDPNLEAAEKELEAAQKAYEDAKKSIEMSFLLGSLGPVSEDLYNYVSKDSETSFVQFKNQLLEAEAKIEEYTANVAKYEEMYANLGVLDTTAEDAAISEAQAVYDQRVAELNAERKGLEEFLAANDYEAAKKYLEDIANGTVSSGDADEYKVYCENVVAAYNSIQEALAARQNRVDEAQSILNEKHQAKNNKVNNYNAVKNELANQKKNLENAQENQANIIAKINFVYGSTYDLDTPYQAVADAQEKVDKMREKSVGATIEAPISGTIASLPVRAGDTTGDDYGTATVLASIQPEGKGYTMSFSVTNEQAKRLSVGDVADLINSWRYDDVEIVLASIKTDKTDPGQKKVLNFNISGDVVPGQSLNVSVGQKSAEYDLIVPNSAIREDNNGKFILIVESKSSPLGNRYVASRVDVQVVASDDTKSAITGGVYGYEFVITTSTKPVEAGQLVRLAEN